MTTQLREAAQALLDEIDPTLSHIHDDAVAALRSALSLPDPGGWAEGAEAMRGAAARMLLAEERRHSGVRAKDALITAHTMLRILPVPPATTAPDYGCKAHDRQGRRCLLQSEHADPCRFGPEDFDTSKPECRDMSPPWFTGRWRDWHRGHGCERDDGKPRTPEGQAEIDAHAAAPVEPEETP